jgi:L-aminopeptidase/D-esterase-like protein
VGAGAGATIGKLGGLDRAMKGGVGSAAITLPSGITVAALVAVNSLGDVIDPATGAVIAGVRTGDGRGYADARRMIRSGLRPGRGAESNTAIGVVATNATLTKAEATRVARMAQDGLARAIVPAHTPWDGDVLFVLATGQDSTAADVTLIGSLAAEAVQDAILRAVRSAKGLPGLPSVSELERAR